jgi:hypothetical protein
MRTLILCTVAALIAAPADGVAQQAIFRFHTDEFWLNLHHFLYVLGRAEAKTTDATREAVARAPADAEAEMARLSADERATWRNAVTFYSNGPSKKDLIFDDPLPALTRALAAAGDSPRLGTAEIDSTMRAVLERAAPIYRKAWWTRQHAANVSARDSIQRMVDRHGRAVLAFITRAYAMQWPTDGYPVHLSGYANWAGAYSTVGNLLVVSSLDPESKGSSALETVFHEGMHQWDDSVFVLLRTHARALGKLVPRDLSHAMIFYTSGEAVRQVIPSHVTTGEAGVWQRGLGRFLDALRAHWQPWLDGKGTRDEALAKLVSSTAVERRPSSGRAVRAP